MLILHLLLFSSKIHIIDLLTIRGFSSVTNAMGCVHCLVLYAVFKIRWGSFSEIEEIWVGQH